MKRVCISLAVILAGVFLFASIGLTTALPPAYAPQQNQYHYGDADGDTAITVTDLNIVGNYIFAQPYTFYTLQADTSDTDWNTCDVDSDQALTVTDRNIMGNYIFGQTVIIADKPWQISAPNLQSTISTTDFFVAFNANLSSVDGASGRPGVSVIARVVPVGEGSTTTGSMSGRECDIIDNTIPDQAALPGAQCALAVTITDWVTDPALGLTESGTYGLQVKGAAPGILYIDLSIQDNGLNVPPISVAIPITIGGTVNQPPTFSTLPVATTCASGSSCGPTANGAITDANAGQTLICGFGSSSCTGVTFGYTGTGTAPGPVSCSLLVNATSAAPQTCNLRLTGADNGTPSLTVGTTVAITISNQAPTWATAPVAVTVASGATYGPTVNGILTDPNYGQTLTCSAGSTNCTGVTFTYPTTGAKPLSCQLTVNATAAAPQTCNVRLRGADNGTPSLTVGATITITVSNQAPTWATAPGAFSVITGGTYGPTVNGVLTDPNYGQTLSCSPGSTSCTGVTTFTYTGTGAKPLNCTLTFRSTNAQTCNIRLVGADNGTPSLTVGATVAVTVSPNGPPAWATAPVAVTVASGATYGPTVNGTLTNPEAGQTLTCSTNSTSCVGTTITYTGTGTTYPVSCTLTVNATAAAPQTCNLRLVGTDNGTPAMSVGTTITVTITNQAPTFSTAPIAVTVLSGATYGPTVNGILTDPNAAQTLTCSAGSTSCVGTVMTYAGTGAKPLNCTLTVNATAAAPQTCNLRLVGADNGTPSLTVGATIVVTIGPNRAPTFSTAPVAVTVASGATYGPTVNGVLTDLDAAQTLTCSPGSTSCVGTTITYTGTGAKPVNCTLTVNATAAAPQTCNLRLVGTDNGTPALTVGATIVVTITNQAPTWATAPVAITVAQNATYGPTVNGVLTDPNAGQTLTCSAGSTSCTGVTTFTYTGTGAKPLNCTLTFRSTNAQTCNIRLVGADNGTPSLTVGATVAVTVTVVNVAPTFATAPVAVTVASGATYGPTVNGTLTDANAGQTLTCSPGSTSCVGTTITYTGSGTTYPVSCTLTVNATAAAPQTCNLRLVGTDNGTPALTVGATIVVTITNQAPTWATAPVAITVAQNATYGPTVNGVLTDPNAAQTLSCSPGSTNCTGVTTFTYTGSGAKPVSCTLTFTSTNAQTCNIRLVGADNGTPSLTVGATVAVTVTVVNVAPTFATAPVAVTVASGATYGPTVNGTLTDANAGQTLTCSPGSTSCVGTTITYTGSGTTYPVSCTLTVNATAAAPQTCNLRLVGTDNGTPALTVGATIVVTITNQAPTWATAPVAITATNGSYPATVNGIITDPNAGQTLSCSPGSTNCTGVTTFTYTGSGAKPVSCTLTFTSTNAQTCNIRLVGADNGSPSLTVGATVAVTVTIGGTVTWTGTSVTGTVGGINPLISRIQTNYPADFNQITLNFSGAVSACSAVTTCGAITTSIVGGQCRLTATAGYWTSNSACTISTVTSTPACTNCTGLTQVFNTSLRLSECAPRGGTCGGFIDNGTYGSGNSMEVDTIDFRQYGGQRLFGGGGNTHVYVLVEHVIATPAVKIEAFDGDDNGITTITSANGLLSAEAKVTAAYKGNTTGMCDNTLAEYPKCYRFTTWDNLDSRKINLPMEQTIAGGDYQMPEAQIWGYTPVGYYSRYVGQRVRNNVFPNPLRGGFALLGLLDQSMAQIDLANLLRTTGDMSTISLCFGGVQANIGGLSLPGNLVLPDVIRQTWNAACSSSFKSSPAYTTFRIFTNRPNIQRKIFILGASVVSSLFNVYKSLDLMVLPITMTAMGTSTLNVPAIPNDINMGDSGGTWTAGTNVPRSLLFELDYRAPAQGIGRFVNLNEWGPPLDQERVRMGTAATPDYGDPNRVVLANHVGQFYCFGEHILVGGVRSGAAGLIPFQLRTTPQIDDTNFTVFQRMNASSKAFTNVRPWSAGGNTLTISANLRGLPSTAADTDVNWAAAETGAVGLIVRGFLEPYVSSGAASMMTTIPGGASNAQMLASLESINGTNVGAAVWLPLPEIQDPTHNGYYVPPQADTRGWPINRNGQIMRGTARMANDFTNTAAGGARRFYLRNPQANTNPVRYADIFQLDLIDPRNIANQYSDVPRGQPDDFLWKYYGAVGGQANLMLTLPFIMPRRASLGGVNGIVPDPWEAGNMTNQTMEWSLTEFVIDTGARGINAAYKYRNMNVTWLYERTYLTGTEQHAFIWR